MSTNLTTKLHVPPLRSGHVSRPRLVSQLSPGPDGRITLVSAPAGYGKTTLVVEWLAESHAAAPQVAWLSLDEHDNDPVRFLTHLVAAMRPVNQSLGEATLSLLQAPQPPPPEAVIGALINDIATLPARRPSRVSAPSALAERPPADSPSPLLPECGRVPPG